MQLGSFAKDPKMSGIIAELSLCVSAIDDLENKNAR